MYLKSLSNPVNGISNSFKNVSDSIDSIKNFFNHPLQKTGEWILVLLITNSRWICLNGAAIALILYIMGIDKAGKYVGVFTLTFFLLQCLRLAL